LSNFPVLIKNLCFSSLIIGLRQQLFENSLSLVLEVGDIFKSLKRETTINVTDFTGWFKLKRDSRVIYFGFTCTYDTPLKKA